MTFRVRTRRGVQTELASGRVIHSRMDDDAWVVGLEFNEVLTARSTPVLCTRRNGWARKALTEPDPHSHKDSP